MVLDCPHCRAKRTGFKFGGEMVSIPDATGGRPIWNTLFMCRQCRRGIVIEFRAPRVEGRHPSASVGNPCDDGFQSRAVYPKPQPTVAPEYVPDDIAGDFVEAVDNLRRGSFTSAGMMFRRVLEQATLEIDPGEARASGPPS